MIPHAADILVPSVPKAERDSGIDTIITVFGEEQMAFHEALLATWVSY